MTSISVRRALLSCTLAALTTGIACGGSSSGDGGTDGAGAADGASDQPQGGDVAKEAAGGTGGSGGAGGAGGAGGGANDAPTEGGSQPLGALCVMSSQCSQADGTAVCCTTPGCGGPCTCTLEAMCPGGTMFLPCDKSSDCDKYGGGKICCEQMSGGKVMRFCTKKSACGGMVLP